MESQPDLFPHDRGESSFLWSSQQRMGPSFDPRLSPFFPFSGIDLSFEFEDSSLAGIPEPMDTSGTSIDASIQLHEMTVPILHDRYPEQVSSLFDPLVALDFVTFTQDWHGSPDNNDKVIAGPSPISTSDDTSMNDVPDLYDQSLLTGDRRSVHAGSLPLQAPTDQMVPALSPTEVQAPLIMTAQIKSFELLCDPQNTVFVNQAPDGLPAAQEEIAPTLDKRQLILWGPARETIVKHFPTYSQHEIP
ncbi:hypothetical protein F5B17DRAFT_314627 [Nemania serpens]|nr:hypothetical protein F5B17DRAFT_314627 [Nemania serpens]